MVANGRFLGYLMGQPITSLVPTVPTLSAQGGERSFAETGLNGEVAPKLLIGERFAAGGNIRVVASGQGRDQKNVGRNGCAEGGGRVVVG